MKILFVLLLVLGMNLSASADGSKRHFCQPDESDISCRLELALVCGAGYIDGYLNQTTNVHKCVLKQEGPSCDLEVQILCPAGFRDGCEIGRTTRHQCVPVTGPACKEGGQWVCPDGFTDRCEM